MEDQARLAQEARAFYVDPGHYIYDKSKPSAFDLGMLDLFDSIEGGRSDIDKKIEQLHDLWKSEGFWARRRDENKVNLLWSATAGRMMWGRQSASMVQLKENWQRVKRIVNGHRFSVYTIASEWVGPPAGQQVVAEPSLD